MRIRAGSVPGSPSAPSRRKLPVAGLLLALVVGFAIGMSLPDSFGQALDAALRAPGTVLRGWRLRRQLPSLGIDVDFESYQQWIRVSEAQRVEGVVPSALDCVAVQLSGGEGALAATLCPAVASPRPDTPSGPAFTIEVTEDAPWLGARRVKLAPAGPSSVLGLGSLRMAAGEGQHAVPHRQFVDVSVNGSGWGVYVLEAEALGTVSETSEVTDTASQERVLVTFDSTELPQQPPAAPGRSFAYARPVLTPVAGAGIDDALLARAAGLLVAVESGVSLSSAVVDPDVLGQSIAATALWHGSFTLDWQTLVLVYDPGAGRFTPVPVGWAPDPATPLPVSFVDDPVVQRAIAAWLDRYGDPGLVDSALASGDLEALFVALGGKPGVLRSTLLEHQDAIRAAVAPSRTLFASIAEDGGAVRIDLRAVLPFPVELLGLDFDGQGYLPLDPAWVPDDDAALWVVDGAHVVLAARAGDEPVVASLTVPMTSLPSALRVGQGTLSLDTRLWGLETSIPVPVREAP